MNRQLHTLTFTFASFLLFSCGSEDQTAAKNALAKATPAEIAPAPKSSLLADLPLNDDPNSNTFQTLDGHASYRESKGNEVNIPFKLEVG